MIVISGALVLVALVLLLIGLLQPELGFVYASIVVSLISFAFLLVGILQRRREQPEAATSDDAAGKSDAPAGKELPPVDLDEGITAVIPATAAPEAVSAEQRADVVGSVLVVEGRPRYHVEGCRYLTGKTIEEMDVADAREDGFTACGVCKPDLALEADQTKPQPEPVADAEPGDDAEQLDDAEPEVDDDTEVDDEPEVDDDEPDVEPEPTVIAPVPAAEVLPPAEAAALTTRTAAKAPAGRTPAKRPATKAAPSAARTAKVAPAAVPVQAAPPAVPATQSAPAKRPAAKRAAAKASAPATRAAKAPVPLVTPIEPAAATRPAKRSPASSPAVSLSKPAAAAAPAAGKKGAVVVIPDRGRFHRADCRYVRGNDDAETLSRAQATRQGYEPCGVCTP